MRIALPACLALLLTAWAFVVAPNVQAQDGTFQPPPDPVFIEGRVVDEAGQPVAGVGVCAAGTGFGRTLWSAQRHAAYPGGGPGSVRTDGDGRFAVAVPFADVLYTVGLCRGSGYRADGRMALAGAGGVAVELVVVPHEPMRPIRAEVYRGDGSPAAGETVVLVGENGSRWTRVADARGRVVFDDVRVGYLGQASLEVASEGEVAPLAIVRWREDAPTVVHLAEPAMLTGVVRSADTGEPIGGATVIIAPRFASGLEWSATTTGDGWFQILDLPPGDYYYRAVSATHADRPPRGRHWSDREVTLGPGGSEHVVEFDMRPRATLRGRVLDLEGNPVAGALIGTPSHHGSGSRVIDAVYTDAQGRYELRPGLFERGFNPLEAFHPLAGGALIQLEEMSPGEVREGVELVLGGSARVRGRVTDAQGRPIPGIWCRSGGPSTVGVPSDDTGHYDLGRVRLGGRASEPPCLQPVMFMGDRPSLGLTMPPGGYWHQRQIDEPKAAYYIAAARHGEPDAQGEAVVNIRLQTTDLLTFTGGVSDPAGEPRAHARVYLFVGEVSDEEEEGAKALADFIDGRDRSQRGGMRGGNIYIPGDNMRDLVMTFTDKHGRWAMQCLRSDTDPRAVGFLGTGTVLAPARAAGPEGDIPDPATVLESVTVLVVWGEGDYELHGPIELLADQDDYELSVRNGGP